MDKNMDIKDLFKQLKEGSKKKDARKGGSLNAFFDKNFTFAGNWSIILFSGIEDRYT